MDLVRRRKVNAIIALKLDRLFRNCAECLSVIEGWDRCGVAVHLVDLGGQAVDTSSAMGRFFLTIMAGAAELERNQVRERTSLAMRELAKQGRYAGGKPPFGFEVRSDGLLDVSDHEQALIARVNNERAAGSSLRDIVHALATDGCTSRSGKPLGLTQVARLLRK